MRGGGYVESTTKIISLIDLDQRRQGGGIGTLASSETPEENQPMSYMPRMITEQAPAFSPLLLSDHLLTLAEDADRAGYRLTAEHLLFLASEVLDQPVEVSA